MTPLEMYLHNHPIIGLSFLALYLYIFGRTIIGIVGALVQPSNPEQLMTQTEKVRWRVFNRVSDNIDAERKDTTKEGV